MSENEPVSAFGAFQATRLLSESKKKSKKQSKERSANGVSNGKRNTQAAADAVARKHNESQKAKKSVKSNKPEQIAQMKESLKHNQNKNKSKKNKHKGDKSNMEEQMLAASTNKMTKAEQNKKQKLESYLARQMEKDQDNSSDDDFNSDEDGNGVEYLESYECSNENTIDDSGNNGAGFWGGDPETDGTVSGKNKRKRKNSETTLQNKTTKAVSVKKSKKTEEQKGLKSDELQVEQNKHKKSLPTFKEKYPTPKSESKKVPITSSDVKLEPLSPPNNIGKVSSIDEGKRAFQWLLNPLSVDEFMDKYWEAKACLIKRKQSNYFSHLISFEAIDKMLIKNHVEFTKNLDVTSYVNGIRETLNPEGRAMPPVVWDFYGQGCSIRLLNPQTFLPELYTLNTTMQEYFHCLVGANAYLTPPNSQGFAPHYDDIEAFVIQIEGRKRWRLYKPRTSAEILPRESSQNFTQKEIGKPILEEVLEPGDVLYFPRGTIHQASTEPGYHSLHITLSVYQKQSYADLFEKMFPLMLKKAISGSVDMRRGLPLTTWQNAGIAFSENDTKDRANLVEKVKQLLHRSIKELPLMDILDAAVDQVAKKFQHEALPPEILPYEKARTVFGSRNHTNERGECVCDYDIDERTNVRLLRANIMRLVDEEEKIRIYYYLDNSKEYCEYEPNFIEIEAMEAASVEVLIKSYPAYIGVSQLPLPSDDQKINLVTALWERGLLMMEKPFK
uniref:Bifunctional lysine-specific demethylase and histidyl-hydroxylase n=1 Tax=Stomoxys calcitrans TaxID=35570 RepID=A0A1I8Q8M4_STOCA